LRVAQQWPYGLAISGREAYVVAIRCTVTIGRTGYNSASANANTCPTAEHRHGYTCAQLRAAGTSPGGVREDEAGHIVIACRLTPRRPCWTSSNATAARALPRSARWLKAHRPCRSTHRTAAWRHGSLRPAPFDAAGHKPLQRPRPIAIRSGRQRIVDFETHFGHARIRLVIHTWICDSHRVTEIPLPC